MLVGGRSSAQPLTPRRTTIHATRRAAAAAATALALLGLAGPVEARESIECFASVPGVTARGVPTTLRYEDGRSSNEKRGPDALGYQPRDIAHPHFTKGVKPAARQANVRSYWFTLSGKQLREVKEIDRRDANGLFVSAEYETRVVRKNWSAVRQISIGRDRDHLYVLTNTGQLLRYRITGKDGNASVKYDATVGIGFGSIGTFEYARTLSILGSPFDVFLATDADSGELLEYTIPVTAPTAYVRTVLGTSGWADMRSASRQASCLNPNSGRTYDAIVGVDVSGAVRLWTDRDGDDGLGMDIVDRGVIKSRWKPMPYSD
jgi:hypothetical protein